MDAKSGPELGTSWAVRAAAGEPTSVIRVRDLRAVIQAGRDAWGRGDKLQPVVVSAEISLSEPFTTAMSTDTVSSDTVHYGTLSKTILGCLDECGPAHAHADSSLHRRPGGGAGTLRDVLDLICLRLTGLGPDGRLPDSNASSHSEASGPRPLLEARKIRFFSLSAYLPKASLLGEGAGLTTAQLFRPEGYASPGPVAPEIWTSMSLQLRNLRVPTLIGVNSNERVTKQVVVVSVVIDRFDLNLDVYTSLEALIVKVVPHRHILSSLSPPYVHG